MSDWKDRLGDEEREALRSADVPRWTSPQLATLVDEPFSDPGWIFERKLDGERCLAFRDGREVRLLSRSRRCLDTTYPELVDALETQAEDRFVLDGEVVAFSGGVTSFSRLQDRMGIRDAEEARASNVAVRYYLFDVLHLGDFDVTALPQRARKSILKMALEFRDPLRYMAHRNEEGKSLLREACEKGWEGLIAKKADAPYRHSRTRSWRKLKCVARQELVVGGWTDPEGERIGFGALLLGYHEGDALRYAGRVGTGFADDTLESLASRLARLERKTPPFDDAGEAAGEGVHWATPRLVAEVAFTEWTDDGKLRHPRFVGLRRDKDPEEVVRERPEEAPE